MAQEWMAILQESLEVAWFEQSAAFSFERGVSVATVGRSSVLALFGLPTLSSFQRMQILQHRRQNQRCKIAGFSIIHQKSESADAIQWNHKACFDPEWLSRVFWGHENYHLCFYPLSQIPKHDLFLPLCNGSGSTFPQWNAIRLESQEYYSPGAHASS